MNGLSEGDCLNEWGDECYEENKVLRTHGKRNEDDNLAEEMLGRYEENKTAKVGSTISCACCGKETVKTTYHKSFCSNGKTKKGKGGNCKDRFWNTVDFTRKARAQAFNRR